MNVKKYDKLVFQNCFTLIGFLLGSFFTLPQTEKFHAKIFFVLICLFLSCQPVFAQMTASASEQKPHTIKLAQAYIGLYIGDIKGNAFFPVMVDQEERPYLPLRKMLSSWLELRTSCQNDTRICKVQMNTDEMPGLKKPVTFWLNGQTYKIGHTSDQSLAGIVTPQTFPEDTLIEKNGQLWLRYDVFGKWLPLDINWDLTSYQIYIIPKFQLSQELQQARYSSFKLNRQRTRKRKKLLAQKPLTPKSLFNIQGRYRAVWTNPLQNDQEASLQYGVNVDLFKGTLLATGNLTTESHQEMTPSYWSYTLRRPGVFHALQFGNVNFEGTMLVPSINVDTGIRFTRFKRETLATGYQYQGYTMPSTEIDIWRNGVLEQIVYANPDGSYRLRDPSAAPGDTLTLKYYYKNGQQEVRTIRIAQDNNFRLHHGQWNPALISGHLEGDGQFTRAAFGYGLSDYLTGEVDAYQIPPQSENKRTNALGFILNWQAIPWMNIFMENLNYSGGSDYAGRINISYFLNHFIQLNYENMRADGPFAELQGASIYNGALIDQIAPMILPTAARSLSLSDTFNTGMWRWHAKYLNGNIGQFGDLGISRSFGSHFSASWENGYVLPKSVKPNFFSQLTATYNFTPKTFVQGIRLWNHDESETQISLQHQGGLNGNWDASIGADKYDNSGHIDLTASIQRRFHRKLSIGLSYNNDDERVSLELAWQDVLTPYPGPKYYEDFATGTVAGRVMSPPEGGHKKPTPIDHAFIDIGGKRVETDDKGYYLVTGLPTDTKLTYSIEADSLNATLIPDKRQLEMRLRPGTYIIYNPQIDIAAGVSGTVLHDGVLPKGLKIEALRTLDSAPTQVVTVDPDGFFVFDKLIVGKYYLRLKGIPNPPAPMKINIPKKSDWLSDVRYEWLTKKTKANMAKEFSTKPKVIKKVKQRKAVDQAFHKLGE